LKQSDDETVSQDFPSQFTAANGQFYMCIHHRQKDDGQTTDHTTVSYRQAYLLTPMDRAMMLTQNRPYRNAHRV